MDQANVFCPFNLIDEKGILDVARIEAFVKEVKLAECGLSYATVSIMGPQSSGKSTLLNHLFGTNFREMDALNERCQITKGIWLAKCPGIEPCTLVMDLEGTDGRERGEDDTAFEKQAALFALAVSDIVIINMWCHDVGRVQAANKPLLRTVFQVMRQLFRCRKTTLLFVLRDKTRTPMEIIEPLLWQDIQQIWDSFANPDAEKETPLSENFNVKIVALSSYEEKEEQFKEQVASLRQQFFHSVNLGGLDDAGRDVVPASGFSCSAQQIWKIIKENKDLNIPAHKVMVATVRCEEIANEKLFYFIANKDWCQLDKDVQSHLVPDFGKKLSVVLDTCLSEWTEQTKFSDDHRYDAEVAYFEEGVRTEKRRQLKDKLLQLVQPAYQSLLEHVSSQTLDKFKAAFKGKLNGGEEFYVAARDSTKSFMTQFDEECTDAIIGQANWDLSKLRDKFQHDIGMHVDSVCSSMLFELVSLYEAQLEAALSGSGETLLVEAGGDTWSEIRRLFWREIQSPVNKFSTALSGFGMDEQTKIKMLEKLEDYARGVIQAKARQEAGRVLTHMKDRFARLFSYDSNSKLRVWSGKEDVQQIREAALCSSLRLLSVMAAIRLDDDPDDIENTLFLALMDNNVRNELRDSLASDTWEEVPLSRTLITPSQCKNIWGQFNEYSEPIIIQAQEACKRALSWWSFTPVLAAGAAMGVAGAAGAAMGMAGASVLGTASGPAAKAFGRFVGQVITEAGPFLLTKIMRN